MDDGCCVAVACGCSTRSMRHRKGADALNKLKVSVMNWYNAIGAENPVTLHSEQCLPGPGARQHCETLLLLQFSASQPNPCEQFGCYAQVICRPVITLSFLGMIQNDALGRKENTSAKTLLQRSNIRRPNKSLSFTRLIREVVSASLHVLKRLQ